MRKDQGDVIQKGDAADKSKASTSIGDRILEALSLLPYEKGGDQEFPGLPSQRDHEIIDQVEFVDVSNLTKDDIIVLLMGPTGAGKSTFIQTVANAKEFNCGQVAHGMQSGTHEVNAVRIKFPDNHHVVLVDTPGLDDYVRTDTETLEMIAQWAERIPVGERSVAGILYLHKISDVRMTTTMITKFTAFQKLVGKHFFEHVVLTTTMWPESDDPNFAQEFKESEARESDLQADHWRVMIDRGSSSQRFCRTPESAWDIINYVVRVQSEKVAKDLHHLSSSKRARVKRLFKNGLKKLTDRT